MNLEFHEWIEDWISSKSSHLSSWGEIWFQTPVQTAVRYAHVHGMIHISESSADEHIELFMWLRALTAQATQLSETRSTAELIALVGPHKEAPCAKSDRNPIRR